MTSSPPTQRKGWAPIKGECPACSHGGGWCTQSSDGLVILCRRAPSQREVPQKDGSKAWLHPANGKAQPTAPKESAPKKSAAEWKNIIKQQQTALSPKRLERLAEDLSLSVTALKLYGVGYDGQRDAYSFPMYGGDGKPCGMRLRWLDGTKRSVPGSSNGLFLPANYDHGAEPIPEGVCEGTTPLLLAMPEGPTSAAAAADLGFRAIGRPSNSGGSRQILQLLRRHPKQDVLIVADDEGTKWTGGPAPRPFWPGWEGALQLARDVHLECERLWVVKVLDAAGAKVKDLRKFLQDGGNRPALNAQLHKAVLGQPTGITRYWIDEKFREVEYVRARMKPPAK